MPALRPQARPRIVCSTPPLLKLQRETPCNRAPLSSLASTDGTVTRRQALQHARTPGSNPSIIIKGRSFRDALAGSGDTTSDAAPCPATSAPVVPTTTTTAPLSATAQPAPTVVEKRSTVTQTPRAFLQPPVPVTVNTSTTMEPAAATSQQPEVQKRNDHLTALATALRRALRALPHGYDRNVASWALFTFEACAEQIGINLEDSPGYQETGARPL